jgi:hypothetical protein
MSTYRERREAKAERYREWADKREAKAEQAFEASRAATEHIPPGQPILVGHYSQRGHEAALRRSDNAMRRSIENDAKARSMRSRADNIEAAARVAIYSDDTDAVERLRDKIARLEAQRATMKARNAEFRRTHRAELKALDSAYARDQAMPHQGYELTNLSGNLSRLRKRLASLA